MEIKVKPASEYVRFHIEGFVESKQIACAAVKNDLSLYIYVQDDYRRKKYGTKLFQYILNYIDTQADISYIAYEPQNDTSFITFFEKMGFKKEGGKLIREISYGERIRRNLDNSQVLESLITNSDIRFYVHMITCTINTEEQVRRIVQKINYSVGDLFYRNKATSAFVLTHLGLGDHLGSIGMVRHLSTLYDNVTVVCSYKNRKNIIEFYKDDPTITFFFCENDSDVATTRGCPEEVFKNITAGYDVVITTGMYNRGFDIWNFPLSFYSMYGFDESLYWTHFHVPFSQESLDVYNELKNDLDSFGITNYCTITTGTATGELIAPEGIISKMQIDKEKMLVLNLDGPNAYESTHRYFAIAEKYKRIDVYKLRHILQNSSLLILADSSIFCFAMHLDLSTDKFYYIYRCWEYSKLFSKKGKGAIAKLF